MAISSFATIRLVKYLNGLKVSLFVPCNHHLGNALAILYNKIFLREINQHHTDLTTIVGIDRTR